jgi:hypothetical protein
MASAGALMTAVALTLRRPSSYLLMSLSRFRRSPSPELIAVAKGLIDLLLNDAQPPAA